MCDKERLVSYLYDDLADGERGVFERHLRDCADCRDELNALRGVRADLISWSPPQPDFGFRVVREAKVLPMPAASWRAWWRPAAGLAAAAVLVLAAASAIARVEVHSGPDGFTVRTGWTSGASADASAAVRAADQAPVPAAAAIAPASANAAVDPALIAALDRRLRALEVASRENDSVRNASLVTTKSARAADADIIRRMRELLSQSETRQQGELALRIAQVIRDVDSQRLEDLKRIQQGLRGVEASVNAEAASHRETTNYLLTTSARQK